MTAAAADSAASQRAAHTRGESQRGVDHRNQPRRNHRRERPPTQSALRAGARLRGGRGGWVGGRVGGGEVRTEDGASHRAERRKVGAVAGRGERASAARRLERGRAPDVVEDLEERAGARRVGRAELHAARLSGAALRAPSRRALLSLHPRGVGGPSRLSGRLSGLGKRRSAQRGRAELDCCVDRRVERRTTLARGPAQRRRRVLEQEAEQRSERRGLRDGVRGEEVPHAGCLWGGSGEGSLRAR